MQNRQVILLFFIFFAAIFLGLMVQDKNTLPQTQIETEPQIQDQTQIQTQGAVTSNLDSYPNYQGALQNEVSPNDLLAPNLSTEATSKTNQ